MKIQNIKTLTKSIHFSSSGGIKNSQVTLLSNPGVILYVFFFTEQLLKVMKKQDFQTRRINIVEIIHFVAVDSVNSYM